MIADVAIVVSPRDWAERLHRFVADHGGARVCARVLDGREAVAERYDVLVVDDLTSFLTPRLIDEVHRRGRRILGVFDRIEPAGEQRLERLGVDDVIASSAAPEQMVARIDALALAGRADLDRELTVLTADDRPAAAGDLVAATPTRPSGPVVAVVGASGGVGTTELACALAGAAAGADPKRAFLVDLDEVAPTVAQRLGLALHPNLRTAVDAVQHRTGALGDAVQIVPGVGGVIAGAPCGREATDLRPGEVIDVIDELAATGARIVADVGHRVEDVAGFGGVGRYARARAVLSRADEVIVVVAPSPMGVARLSAWAAEVAPLTAAGLHVAVNRAGRSTFRQGEIEQEIRRTLEPASVAFLPEDRRVPDAAWAGSPCPRGPFAKAVADIGIRVTAAVPV